MVPSTCKSRIKPWFLGSMSYFIEGLDQCNMALQLVCWVSMESHALRQSSGEVYWGYWGCGHCKNRSNHALAIQPTEIESPIMNVPMSMCFPVGPWLGVAQNAGTIHDMRRYRCAVRPAVRRSFEMAWYSVILREE